MIPGSRSSVYEHRFGCLGGVQRIGFAVWSALGAIGPVDLLDGEFPVCHDPGQLGVVRARAFDSDCGYRTEACEVGGLLHE